MFWTIILGLVIGSVAKLLLPGRDPGGWILTLFLGIAGALVGNFIGVRTGWFPDGEPLGILASIMGAVLILVFFRLFQKPEKASLSNL